MRELTPKPMLFTNKLYLRVLVFAPEDFHSLRSQLAIEMVHVVCLENDHLPLTPNKIWVPSEDHCPVKLGEEKMEPGHPGWNVLEGRSWWRRRVHI